MLKYSILGLALMLFGCVTAGGGSPYTETGAICDNTGLESQLKKFHDKSNSLRGALGVGLPSGGGAIGGESSNTNISRQYRVRDKLKDLDAEIDAQYRNVTSSCKAYSRCMEMNRYKEGRCRSGLRRWDDAEDSFSELAITLKELEQSIIYIQNPNHHGRCKGSHCVNDREKCTRTCSSRIGVFSNCCERN